MNVALACIPIAFLLIYAAKIPVSVAMHRHSKAQGGKGYDNRHPRDQQAQLTGWGKRATAAHYNGFETFPGFAAGVLVCYVAQANAEHTMWLSLGYVISRVAYIALYIGDIHWLRSSFWFVGFACILGLLALPLLG
jgi:uncharacterized MAPEG superfamily protein